MVKKEVKNTKKPSKNNSNKKVSTKVKNNNLEEKKKESKKVNENKKKFEIKDFDFNKFKFLVPVFLILFIMLMAFNFRSGPINLDGLENNVQSSILSQIQNVITQDVNNRYPNLNSAYKQELIQEEYQKVLETGEYEIQGQKIIVQEYVDSQTEHFKSQFKADNGQTYLNAIDPYYFLRKSENVLETGTMGELLVNGIPYDNIHLAPSKTEVSENINFHVWLESKLYNLNGIDADADLGEKMSAIFLIPVIFAMLSVILIFLILRKFSNDLYATLGSLFLVTIGTFVSRTVAGFVDTDAYNVFFSLLTVGLLIYAFSFSNKQLTILFAALSGLSLGLFVWAWGSAWYIFLFLVLVLIGYLGYILISNILQKVAVKELSQKLLNDILTLGTFIISSFIFALLFSGKNIFILAFNGIMKSQEKIASVSESYIWPNVYSSVAELNPASFNQIIGSVGGEIMFILAMIGVLFLSIDFKLENKKVNFYRKLLIIGSILWFLIIISGKAFISLTANNSLVFLGLLFFPIGIALLFSLWNSNHSDKIFLSMLLSVWMAGTIYMSLNGVRFILLLAPAFAIAFGLGLYYISSVINRFFIEEFKITNKIKQVLPGAIAILILFLVLYSPMYDQANAISKGTTPNFDDAWFDSMYKIENQTSEDAIITSWWDFGHFFAVVADRGVTFDGASQTTPRSHWVGKLLMENDEQKSVDILRMLTCGGNEAHNLMLEYVEGNNADAVKINKIIYETLGKDLNETRKILKENTYFEFNDVQVDNIMEYLACESPRENILITSQDMIGKAGVWAHWGSWDFTKKYVHDNYRSKSVQDIALEIDENETIIDKYVEELKDIDVRAETQNIKRENLINQWFAPYPSYIPIGNSYELPCQMQNQTLICQNGLMVNLMTGEVIGDVIPGTEFKNLVYPTINNEVAVIEQSEEGSIDVLLVPSNTGFNVMFMQTPLGASLFTKLYFLNGYGAENFELFDDRNSVTGNRIKVWKTLFDGKNESIGDLSNLQIDSFKFNATKEEVEEILGENISE